VKIVDVETFPVGAGWKNWLFVRVLTDEGFDPDAYLDVTAAGWERRLGHPAAVTQHHGGGR
jgi:hypothetical protein